MVVPGFEFRKNWGSELLIKILTEAVEGERSEWCPGGAFARGENEVSESTETSNAKRSKRAVRRLRLRNRVESLMLHHTREIRT